MNRIDAILEKQLAWQVLSDDDPAIQDSALEALDGCAHAIDVLGGNLRRIGYSWVSTERIPVTVVEKNVQVIETKTGMPVPKILTAFWKLVGGVSFIDLENYQHTDFWENYDIKPKFGFADGLHVEGCSEEWTAFACSEFEEWKEYPPLDDVHGFTLSLSPDGYHKDNISGGAPYGLSFESTWKPIWRYFEWSGEMHPVTAPIDPPDFLSYLRTTILECAGFPALLGIPAFETLKEDLLQGVPLF